MSSLRKALEKYWPESFEEDPEEAVDPEIEGVNIKTKMEKLVDQLAHGNHKLAEQKRILKELKHLQGKNERLANDVREAEARIPAPKARWDHWHCGSKYDIQRQMRTILKNTKEEKGEDAWLRLCKEIRSHGLDLQLRRVEQEQEEIQERIAIAQNKITEQAACYDDYITTMNNVKELVAKNDLVALEELSSKQVEDFMSKWKRDQAFRANYNRSVQPSLKNRGLRHDGRRQLSSQTQ